MRTLVSAALLGAILAAALGAVLDERLTPHRGGDVLQTQHGVFEYDGAQWVEVGR